MGLRVSPNTCFSKRGIPGPISDSPYNQARLRPGWPKWKSRLIALVAGAGIGAGVHLYEERARTIGITC